MISARAALRAARGEGDAAALAQWGLGGTNPVDGSVYHWNTDNTTTANDCLCADPALDDNNTIEEDVNAVYLQVAMSGELGGMPTNSADRRSLRRNRRGLDVEHRVPNRRIVWTANNDFTIARSADGPAVHRRDRLQPRPAEPRLQHDFTDDAQGPRVVQQDHRTRDYGNLYAGATVSSPTGSVLIDPSTQASRDAQNPALVPLESDNLDLRVEWYFAETRLCLGRLLGEARRQLHRHDRAAGSLYGITDPTSGPDAQAALAFLKSAACSARSPRQATMSTPPARRTTPRCSPRWRCCAMRATGGLAAYNGSSAAVLAMENAYDLVGEADDPLYLFESSARSTRRGQDHGWELGGQYFFGDTGFGMFANYTIVNGDVGSTTRDPGTTSSRCWA